MGTQKLKKVPMGTRSLKWGPMWEQWPGSWQAGGGTLWPGRKGERPYMAHIRPKGAWGEKERSVKLFFNV